MFILGHVGFTLAGYAVVKRKQRLYLKRALLVGTLALMPDVLDRSLHFIIVSYPIPGVFHSVLFYAMLLPLSYFVFRRFNEYVIIMAGHIVLDVVNTDTSAFLYPLYGWSNSLRGNAMGAPLKVFLNHWPMTIGFKIPTKHYLIFEVLGLALFFLVAEKFKKDGCSACTENAKKSVKLLPFTAHTPDNKLKKISVL